MGLVHNCAEVLFKGYSRLKSNVLNFHGDTTIALSKSKSDTDSITLQAIEHENQSEICALETP